MRRLLIPFLVLMIFAQDMSDLSKLAQEKKKGLNARSQAIDLEELLNKKNDATESELSRIGEYLPVEGSIVDSLYIVGPHDVIAVMYITPDSEEENRLDMIVNPDGEIIIPSYGAAKVSGLSFRDTREIIKEKIKTLVNVSRITVNLIETRIFRAHITGYVMLPGAYNVSSSHRVSDLIDLSGGPAPSADLSSISIIRSDQDLVVDLYQYLKKGDIAQNPFLQDGDIVNIPPLLEGQRIYVSGAVKSNGYYPFNDGYTLCDYIPNIIDQTQNSDLSNIKILRDRKEYIVDFTEDCSFDLKSDDRVIIPIQMDSVIVGGLVQNGGSYPYKPHATYATYVAMAGGPTEKGGIGRVSVFRDGRKIDKDNAILPGDVIIVKKGYFTGALDLWSLLAQAATVALTIYTIGFKE